jgi:hypothetical protein
MERLIDLSRIAIRYVVGEVIAVATLYCGRSRMRRRLVLLPCSEWSTFVDMMPPTIGPRRFG